MLTLQEVSHKIYNDPHYKNNRVFISLYDENRLLIENAPINTDGEAYRLVTQLMSDYALSLSYSGSYNKAIEYYNKAIPLWENASKLYNGNPFKLPIYEALIWNRATTLHYLKKYDASAKDLKNLIANFPDNDMYRYWLRSTTAHKLHKVSIICWVFAVCGYFCTYIPPKGSTTAFMILYFTIAFFGIGLIIETIKYVLQSKK